MDYQTEYGLRNPTWHEEDAPRKIQEILATIPRDIHIDTAIDVGCGTGLILLGLAKHLGLRKAHGLDISEKAIVRAKQYAESEFVTFAVDKNQNEVNLPIFDVVLFIDVLEHIPEPSKFLLKRASQTPLVIVRIPLEDTVVNLHN